ncbi:MAG: flagellar biosynthesis protein [Butyricicoccus pullicaecorum]|nr:flagellar biosynthesis protein [Butyricicoccus pullicaecorum]MBS5150616.1 flagellar biosynthesis protein [Butyricicoccus pullicaecorum]
MIQQVSTVHQQQTELNKLRLAHNDASFQSMLKERIEQRSSESVRLSRHAQERAQQRGIQMTAGLMQDLQASIDKASAKGARDIVIISPEQAFIVNVPSRLVITAMTTEEMKENVFTNIDGAVIL